jgi:hypothetical protein
MTISKVSVWAGSAATAMTLAMGLLIAELARVDAGVDGLPVVQLERVEAGGGSAAAPVQDIAANSTRSVRGTL